MTTPKMRGIKGGADALPPERRELIEGLRALTEKAISGELVWIAGVAELVTTEDVDGEPVDTEDFEMVMLGHPNNVDAVYRRLGQVQDVVDALDDTSWSPHQPESDDEEAP